MKILLFSNSTNNYLKFRMGLIKKLISMTNDLYIIIPDNEDASFIKSLGINIIKLNLSRHNSSFIKELILMFKIFNIYYKIKPKYALHFTIKPNIYGSIVCKFLNIQSINNITGLGTVFINKKYSINFYYFLYKFALKNNYHTFFQNVYDYRFFKKNKIINKNTSILPGSGVNLKKYKSFFYPSDNEINFLFIGRLIKEKGIFEYLYASRKIKEKFKNVNFYIIGSFDDLNKSSINKKIFNDYLNDKSVIYLGYIDDVETIIEKCHAVILPSFREGMSHSLLVAASMSRPLIASKVPGCKELVKHNLNGYIFESKNKKSLVQAVNNFLKLKNTEKKDMGYQSRVMVEKYYNEDIVIKKYAEIIK